MAEHIGSKGVERVEGAMQQHHYFFSTLQVVGPQTRIKQFPVCCHEPLHVCPSISLNMLFYKYTQQFQCRAFNPNLYGQTRAVQARNVRSGGLALSL